MKTKFTRAISLLIFLFFSVGITITNSSKSSAEPSQYEKDLQIQQLALKGFAYCHMFERRVQSNSNDYQARIQLNNCIAMIQKQGFCQQQKVLESAASATTANFTECDLELANFAVYIGGADK